MKAILVVEDNPSNMKLVADILTRSGYRVLKAEDADAGIAIARSSNPDLILMDIHLPGTDGLTATQLLKSDGKTAHIPIVAVTAKAMSGDREIIEQSGCDGYVPKPIRYKELLRTIDECLAAAG